MLKMRSILFIAVNFSLLSLSWVFNRNQSGDEYLVVFIVILLFILAPFNIGFSATTVMIAVNFIFFIFYRFTGVLNSIDIVVLMALLLSVVASGYLLKDLQDSFKEYQGKDIRSKQEKYDRSVGSLEDVDRRGKKVEKELNRMSRLYEVNKKLAPALRFQELFVSLFDFLEENIEFNTVHLLTFNEGEFSKGISRNKGERENFSDKEADYGVMMENVVRQEYKSFFVERHEFPALFNSLKTKSDTFMAFPLLVGKTIYAVLAIEGATRTGYSRFRILIPQIALEFKKVELYEKIQELSIIDGLTGVYLRRYMMDRLEEEVERAGRLGLIFSIAMIDIDYFKKCNDKYGHLVGDAVLKEIARRLKKSVREVDMVGRYGGEEFCIIFPDTGKELAMVVAERLRTAVNSDKIKVFDEAMKLTISSGVATYPNDGTSMNFLIDKADAALYMAKRKGRDTVCKA